MSEPRRQEDGAKPARTPTRVPFPLTEEQRAQWRPFKRRGWKNNSMVQLTLVRFREFIREPEAVFWTFIFPILLAAGLGLAFRPRGPDKLPIRVISSAPGRTAAVETLKKKSTL